MIRINLLGVERQKARKGPAFDIGQRVTLACSVILVASALGIGWWYWSLNEQSERLDADLAAARQEAARLQSLLEEVKRFEAQRAQLQQRVTLIEQLRSGQSVPVQLLDHVSRSVPDMLWLTELRQEGAEVTIEGRSTTLIGVSDFIGNLAAGELLQKPIDLVNSQVESPPVGPGQASVELVRFTLRAQLAALAGPAAAGGRGAAAGPGRAGGAR
jgi:type IV pilus assembly protein PilN